MKNKSLVWSTITGIVVVLSASTSFAQVKPEVTSRYSSNSSDFGNGITWINVESNAADEGRKLITFYKNGDVYKVTVVADKISGMLVGDKKINESDFGQYEPMIKELLERIKKEQEKAEKQRAIAQQHRAEAEKMREQAEKDREHATLAREEMERTREKAAAQREEAMKMRKQAELDRQKDQQHSIQAKKQRVEAEQLRLSAEKERMQADKARVQAEHQREQADKARAQAEIHRQQAEKERAKAAVAREKAEEDRKMLEEMVDDLVREKIVAGKDELQIVQLTDESLIVNDKKQPAELHQRFKDKYLKKAGSRITYRNSGEHRQWNIQQQ